MIRERIGRALSHAYPHEVLADRGEEMLGTLLDASEHSAAAFARECGLLWLAGMRARARITARVGAVRLVADACCQAAALWLLWGLANVVSVYLAFPWAGARDALLLTVLGGLSVGALAGYDRIVGICGLAVIAGSELLTDQQAATRPYVLASLLMPLLCSAVMAFSPRIRSRDARRLLWLLPAVGAAAILPYTANPGTVLLAAISLIALVRLPADPRPAIACAIVWTALGLGDLTIGLTFQTESTPWIATLTAALVILSVAAARLRSMQHKAQA